MKKLFLVLLFALILLPLSVYPGIVILGGRPDTGGGGAPSYLLSESFDGSTLCATGYTSNCDNTWTVAYGTPDFDYATAPAPIEGSYSLNLPALTNGGTTAIYKSFTATADQTHHVYFKFIINNLGSSPGEYSKEICTLNYGGNYLLYGYMYRVGGNTKLSVKAYGGSAVATVGTLSTGTVYHCWLSFLKGTGSNAIATIAFSTDGVRPTSGNNYAQSTNGTGTSDPNRIYLQAGYTNSTVGMDMLFDHVRIDDETIGDNPS